MLHRLDDRNAGRDAVEDDPSSTVRQLGKQLADERVVRAGLRVDRRREGAGDHPCSFGHAIRRRSDHDRRRAEVFFAQLFGAGERVEIGDEQRRRRPCAVARVRSALHDDVDTRELRARIDKRQERRADAGIEHRLRVCGVQPPRDRVDERIRVVRDEQQARLRAELSGPLEDGRGKHLGDLVAARIDRRGRHEHRVQAPHLRVDRDRVLARGGEVEERASDHTGPGERDGGHLGGQDERTSDVGARALHERERAGRKSGRLDGIGDDARAELGRPRMRRMALRDHRTASRERRRRIAAGNAERQREVARAEHRHGPDRDQHPAHIGSRIGRFIDHGLEMTSGPDEVRERTKLSRRPRAFAHEAGLAECALRVRQRDQVFARAVETVRDGVQQRGDIRGRSACQFGGRLRGRRRGARDLVRCGFVEVGRAPAPGARVDRVEHDVARRALGPRDEVGSRHRHRFSLAFRDPEPDRRPDRVPDRWIAASS